MSTKANQERLERIILGQERLIEEVYGILHAEEEHDALLRAAVRTSRGERTNQIPFPEPGRVFTLEEIRGICIRYGLRFLDGARFKGGIPSTAVMNIRHLEARSGAPLRGFKVLAPSALFRLSDCENDPLLFVPLETGRFYLVHRWGGDLSRWRMVSQWWKRSPAHLAGAVLLVSVLLASVLPAHLLTTLPDPGWWGSFRLFCLFHVTFSLTAFTVFGWFAFHGKFTAQAWNDPHFN
ncbi:MAG: hypothetical protein JNM31_15495 [Flavobacteriales bacterium]|nr:hypothetical protein [Flavobacteriales bacterium]